MILYDLKQPVFIKGVELINCMRSVLLVTAHPDDECMFFTPSIRKFIDEGFRVDLLCLSEGNFDGMGGERTIELRRSAEVLGIDSVTIINDQ